MRSLPLSQVLTNLMKVLILLAQRKPSRILHLGAEVG